MYTVKNISPGPRGFYDRKDGYLELEPGQTATDVDLTEAEFKSAESSGSFEITALKPKRKASAAKPSDGLEKMSDEELRATVAALTGSEPDDALDRKALLALARDES